MEGDEAMVERSCAMPWTARRLAAWAACLALAAAVIGCDTSEGVTCCVCECCDQEGEVKRMDQPWVDCEDPCSSFCERDLACNLPVTRAEECP